MNDEIELDLLWKAETAAAYLVTDNDVTVWLPKSQVDVEESAELHEVCTFLVPEWLATEKGLI